MLSLTIAELESNKIQQIFYIYREEFDCKKISEIKNHCHFTGKNWGATRTIWI